MSVKSQQGRRTALRLVAYAVRRPCCNFTDMLRRFISCRIIITISIIINVHFRPESTHIIRH